jgi:3D (Asp-Asp-Asp) domain-containing protein
VRLAVAVAIALTAAAAAARPAHPDTSKLAKEDVAIQGKERLRGKNKTCCGYPLSPTDGYTLTFYWLAMEDDFDQPAEIQFANPDAVDLYTKDGLFIGSFPDKLAWSLRMEGSGLLADGRVLQYNGRCDYGYGTCFEQLSVDEYPFGRGAFHRPLIPFKSIAVDPVLVPIGEPVYIPEFDGMILPDGSIHDGCVRADDTGGHIKKRHVDFFVVTYGNFRTLLDQMWNIGTITPRIQEPRCEYLRDYVRPE